MRSAGLGKYIRVGRSLRRLRPRTPAKLKIAEIALNAFCRPWIWFGRWLRELNESVGGRGGGQGHQQSCLNALPSLAKCMLGPLKPNYSIFGANSPLTTRLLGEQTAFPLCTAGFIVGS